MQVCVSRSFSNSTIFLTSLILLEDVQLLLDQIDRFCGKISVAQVNLPPSPTPLSLIIRSVYSKQKKTLQLAELCDTLRYRLSNGFLTSPSPEDVQRPAHRPLSIYLLADVKRQ